MALNLLLARQCGDASESAGSAMSSDWTDCRVTTIQPPCFESALSDCELERG